MDLSNLDSFVAQLCNRSQYVKELLFWQRNPEILSISVSVSYEYDDQGTYYASRTIDGMEFASDPLQISFLQRIGMWDEGNSIEDFDLDNTLDDIDEEIAFSGTVANCPENTEYRRPEGDIDTLLVDLEKEVEALLLDGVKGATVYAVMEPSVDYDDQNYYATDGSYLTGLFTIKERAHADQNASNCEIVSRYSVEEVDPDGEKWWGDEDPDEWSIETKVAKWWDCKSEFLATVQEVTLQ